MNYCPNCGNRLSPADVLCPRCGSLVEKMRPDDFIAPPGSIRHSASRGNVLPPSDAAPQSEAAAPQASVKPSEIDDKNWLEIEEINKFEAAPSDNEQASSDISSDFAPDGQPSGTADSAQETETDIEPAENSDGNTQDFSEEPDDSISVKDEIGKADIAQCAEPARRRNLAQAGETSEEEPYRPGPSRRIPGIVGLFLWILAAAAIFAGFYFADSYVTDTFGGWNGFVREISKGKVDLDTESAYTQNLKVSVSGAQTEEGAPAHRFDVSMPDGLSVRVLPLGDTYNMENGSVTFTISDETIATSLGVVTAEAEMETSGVSLDVTTASQTINYPAGALTLKLTDADYKRDKPSAQTQSTTDTGIKIVLTVSPEATVFINNANQSAGIDEFGHLSVSMPLELGDNSFVIEVIQPGRRSVKETFTMTRVLPETSLTLRDVYLRVFDSSFECRGTTASGGSVTALLDGRKFTALVGSDGVFSIACSLEKTGVYQMDVTASKDGCSDATSPVLVEYLPSQAAFIEACKEMAVSKIIKDTASLKGKSIKTTATIDGNIDSDNHKQTFMVKAKDGAAMACYYYGAEHLSAELEYTFYGVWNAETNSFYVMFVE